MLRIRYSIFFCTLLLLFFLLLWHTSLISFSQPKLVVGIVIDQMRYDYIEKYWNKFGNDGFKRLVNEGFSCKNTNYNYVPTFTAPGHASIYTGSVPSVHGIVSNAWIDKERKKVSYCVYDQTVSGVGTTSYAGKMSPRNLLSGTVCDELQNGTQHRSKVIGIALKDRGAILPAGHKATAAYWFDNGNWISSTYYMKELPKWVNDFNKKELVKKYLSQQWTTLLPIEEYTASDVDDNECENLFKGIQKPVFPYNLPTLMKENGGLGLIRSTPFGNSLTKDFAMDAIRNENMGKRGVTDFLCISFSSPDIIGHQFGPQSVEIQDCYLRLDKDISEFLTFLEKWVGKHNVLVFLTSDHGTAEAVPCTQKKGLDAGIIHEKALSDSLKNFSVRTFNDTFLMGVSDFDIYLNHEHIIQKGLNVADVSYRMAKYLTKFDGIAYAITATELKNEKNFHIGENSHDSILAKVKAGFHPVRSGDIIFVLKPNWLEGFNKGATHGSPYKYDTHVPLIWWGYTVKSGSSDEPVAITQITPTLVELLNISKPKGCNSDPIKLPVK